MNHLARVFVCVACGLSAMGQTAPSTLPSGGAGGGVPAGGGVATLGRGVATSGPAAGVGSGGASTLPGGVVQLVSGVIPEGVNRPIPGTHVRLTVPGACRRSRALLSFVDPLSGLEVRAVEMRFPFASAAQSLLPSGPLSKIYEIGETVETRVDGRVAVLVTASRRDAKVPEVTRFLVMGNALSSAMLTVTYPTANEGSVGPVAMSVLASARWDPSADLHAAAVMPFEFSVPPGYKLVRVDGRSLTYAEGGRARQEDVEVPKFLLGTRSFSGVSSLENAKKMFATSGGPDTQTRVLSCQAVKVGDLEGFEGYLEITHGTTVLLAYMVQLVDGDVEYSVLGQAGREQFKGALPVFQTAVRTIKPVSSSDLNDPDR